MTQELKKLFHIFIRIFGLAIYTLSVVYIERYGATTVYPLFGLGFSTAIILYTGE